MPNADENRTAGRIRIRVRYCECDPMGLAHHSSYPVWFEMGRTELYRENGRDYRDFEAQGLFLAVAALQIKYKRPARYDDVMELETRLAGAGRVKLEHTYELWRGEERRATGSTTLACIDRQGRLRPLPECLLPQMVPG